MLTKVFSTAFCVLLFLFLSVDTFSQVVATNDTDADALIRVTVDCSGVATHMLPVVVGANSTVTINLPAGCGSIGFVEWAITVDLIDPLCGWSRYLWADDSEDFICNGTHYYASTTEHSASSWSTTLTD